MKTTRCFAHPSLLSIAGCACAVLLAASFSSARQQPPPQTSRFVLAEVEEGEGSINAQAEPGASGGRRIVGFGKGKSVSVVMSVMELMPEAMLYIRYARAAPGEGSLAVLLAPASAVDAGMPALRQPEFVSLPSTGNGERYRWAAISQGRIEPGRWRVTLINSDEGEAGNLDAIVLANDTSGGTRQPPNRVIDGKLAGGWSLRPFLEIVRVTGPIREENGSVAPGHPVRFVAAVRNHRTDAPAAVILFGELHRSNGQGRPIPVFGAPLTLAPGATGGAPLTVRALESGEYILTVMAATPVSSSGVDLSSAAIYKTTFLHREAARKK